MFPNNIFDPESYQDILNRISKLKEGSTPAWGKMNVSQMMAHCTKVNRLYSGQGSLGKVSFLAKMMKGMIKKSIISPNAYKKNSLTAPVFKVIDLREFQNEKSNLIDSLEALQERHKLSDPFIHELFGAMTKEEIGWAMYKHIDHHLKQFQV